MKIKTPTKFPVLHIHVALLPFHINHNVMRLNLCPAWVHENVRLAWFYIWASQAKMYIAHVHRYQKLLCNLDIGLLWPWYLYQYNIPCKRYLNFAILHWHWPLTYMYMYTCMYMYMHIHVVLVKYKYLAYQLKWRHQ